MKKNQKHIDDFFKEKLGNYSEQPPADAWSDLDARLDTLVPQAVPTSPFRWLGHVAMVSVIAVLSVSLFHKFGGKNENNSGTIAKVEQVGKMDATNTEMNVNGSEAGIGQVNVPTTDINNGNEQNALNGTGGQSVSASTSVGASEQGGNSTPIAKTNSAKNNKQTKRANYAPYNNGLAKVRTSDADERTEGYGASDRNSNNNEEVTNVALQSGTTPTGVAVSNSTPASDIVNEVKVSKQANTIMPTKKNEVNTAKDDAKRTKPEFGRWGAGVKGGYEKGINALTYKYVVSPYVQYNISKRAAIMLQPAAKFANSPVRVIGSPQSYYKVNADGKVVDNGSYVTTEVLGTGIDTTYHAKYRYTQSHDSIVKTDKAGGTYMEYELPVLFKYNISKNVSVYGGPNMVLSQMRGVTEHTYTKTGIVRTVDTMISGKTMATAPDINDVIKYGESPISTYNGPLYPASQESKIRMGAMVGFSYEYSDRLMLDALIQQAPAPRDVRGGFNINAPLSATYFRLSVGYKLTK